MRGRTADSKLAEEENKDKRGLTDWEKVKGSKNQKFPLSPCYDSVVPPKIHILKL